MAIGVTAVVAVQVITAQLEKNADSAPHPLNLTGRQYLARSVEQESTTFLIFLPRQHAELALLEHTRQEIMRTIARCVLQDHRL